MVRKTHPSAPVRAFEIHSPGLHLGMIQQCIEEGGHAMQAGGVRFADGGDEIVEIAGIGYDH